MNPLSKNPRSAPAKRSVWEATLSVQHHASIALALKPNNNSSIQGKV